LFPIVSSLEVFNQDLNTNDVFDFLWSVNSLFGVNKNIRNNRKMFSETCKAIVYETVVLAYHKFDIFEAFSIFIHEQVYIKLLKLIRPKNEL